MRASTSSYHSPRPARHRAPLTLATCLVLVATTLGAARPAHAQLTEDSRAATDYRRARRMIEDDAFEAYAIARTLPRFRHADAQRVELLGQAALSAGDAPVAIENLLDYAEQTDSFKAAFDARIDAAELMLLTDDRDRARTLLERLDRDRSKLSGRFATRRHLSARVVRLLHDIAQADGDERRAQALAKNLLVTLPAQDATLRPGLAATPDDLAEYQRFARAKAAYNGWAYELSRDEFQRFVDSKKWGEEARWHLAQIALNKLRDDFPLAERYFADLSKSGRYAEESLYQLARAKMRQERYEECLKDLDAYAERYPKGSRVELVYYYRGWLFYDRRDNDRAIRGFERYIDRYGKKGRKTTYVHGFLAWAYMREQRWDEALGAWDDLMSFGNPIVAGKAMYWKAHAYLGKKDEERALEALDRLRERYPVSYYGMLGEQLRAQIEGRDARASQIWWPEGSGSYDDSARVDVDDLDTARLTPAERQQWAAVRELAALDEKRLARDALSPIYSTILRVTPASKKEEWIHALGLLVDDYNKMWRVGGRSSIGYLPPVPDSDPLRSVMAYPRAYADEVEAVAREFDLPPYLIWAIMRQESRYKPGAISHTDAVGALQMIPKTARLVAQDLGIEYNPRTFHYPEVGFRFSGFYMRKLLDLFDGMYTPMAGSYNSGPQVVSRWFERNPEAPFPYLIEEFEYNEGRAYSRKVTEHMTRYIYLYETDPERRAELLDKLFPLDRTVEFPDDVGY